VTRRQLIAGAGLVALVALAAWLGGYLLWFQGLVGSEALNQAQIARHLAQGAGFRTSVATPLGLTFDPRVRDRPDTTTPPLGPWWTSLFFRAFGARDSVAAVGSGVAFVLSALALYWLGLRLAGPRLAVLIGVLYSLSFPVVGSALSGAALPLVALLGTLFFVALSYVAHQPEMASSAQEWLARSRPVLLAAGLLAGLAALAEYCLLPLPLAAAWYVRGPDRPHRLRAAGWVLAGALVALLPWAVRQALVTGRPLFSVQGYDLVAGAWAYPGRAVYRELDPEISSPIATALVHWRELPRKWGLGLSDMREGLMRNGDLVLAALFVGGLLFPFEQRRAGRLRGALLVAILLATATGCLLSTRVSLTAAFFPAMAAFGLGRVGPLLSRLDGPAGARRVRRSTLVLGGLSLLVAWPFVGAAVGFAGASGRQELARPNLAAYEWLRAAVPAEAIVMTDAPWEVAWRAQRFALELCNTDRQLDMIDDVVGIDALYFTGSFQELTEREYAPPEHRGDWWQYAYRAAGGYKGFVMVPDSPTGQVLRVPAIKLERAGGAAGE